MFSTCYQTFSGSVLVRNIFDFEVPEPFALPLDGSSLKNVSLSLSLLFDLNGSNCLSLSLNAWRVIFVLFECW